MNSIISWVGGKKALRDLIYLRMPTHYDRYIEVFGGGGWVLFGKPPDKCMEVYNDFNSNLANLFYCVKERPMALLRELSFLPLNSRDEFVTLRKFLTMEEFKSEHLAEELEIATHFLKEPEAAEICDILKERAVVGDVKRAAAFYKIIRYSYGSGCISYGCQPFDIRKTFTILWEANRRLKDTVIENKDFEALIRQYDRPNAFFYCDPPYFETEGHYEVVFRKEDHVRLRKISEKYEKRQFKLTTNGTVMNWEIAQFLLDNFQNGVSLSVDGNESTHDSNRVYIDGKGSFKTVMENISTYFTKEQYSKFTIRMTLTSETINKLFDNCTYFVNMGFSTIITALNQYDKAWNAQKFEKLQGQVYDIYQEAIKSGYEEKGIYLSVLDWRNRVKGECKISKENLKIYVNGDVYPCIASVGDESLILGNIHVEPFANIDLIERICRINKMENPECGNCKHKPYCVNSRCKLVNRAYNGDFLKPSGVECAYQNMIVNLQNLI